MQVRQCLKIWFKISEDFDRHWRHWQHLTRLNIREFYNILNSWDNWHKINNLFALFLGWERSRWLNENLCWTRKKEKRKKKQKELVQFLKQGFRKDQKNWRGKYKRRHEEKIMKKKVFTIFTIFFYFSISKNSCQFSLNRKHHFSWANLYIHKITLRNFAWSELYLNILNRSCTQIYLMYHQMF